MSFSEHIEGLGRRLEEAWRTRAFIVKAASFASVGFVNAVLDATIFFLVYSWLKSNDGLATVLAAIADAVHFGSVASGTLALANICSWTISASNSYVMNSYITFAVESGRKLTLRAYASFLASGVLGLTVNTLTLILVAKVLPVWAAKGCAIMVGFVVNFSMSNFVVFRRRASAMPEQ
jgi:putative flippase GtrA